MKADFHMHSSFSSDAEFEPEAMIQEAIRRGLQTICFTDHQDKDYQGGPLSFTFDTEFYFRTMQRLQQEYREKIDVRIGACDSVRRSVLSTVFREKNRSGSI